jgi:hypothetical protein
MPSKNCCNYDRDAIAGRCRVRCVCPGRELYCRGRDAGAGQGHAKRHDAIVAFGETRIHAETATFEVRVSEVASPRAGDQLTLGGETFVVQGEPERRDPDRLVWTLDTRPI